MNTIWTISVKDLKTLWRDKAGLFWVLVFPLLTAVLFGAIFSGADGGTASKMKIAVQDFDNSSASQSFVKKLAESESLALQKSVKNPKNGVRKGDLVALVVIPKGYGDHSPFSGEQPEIEVAIDPARKAEAGFLQGILAEASFAPMQESFSNPAKAKIELEKSKAQVAAATDMKPAEKESLVQFLGAADQYFSSTTATEGGASPFSGPKIKQIPVSSEEIGPSSSYEITFPQGILWGLISVAASFSLSMVRERVGGTFLRLRVAPITRNQLLLGKALACFLSCAAVISLLLAVGAAIFHLRFSSPGLLLMAIGSSSAAFVGIMMLLSVLGKTEAAVSGSGWAVLMVMSMFGGGMVPVIMMPGWMQAIGSFSPVKWAILSFEGAIWRGFSFSEMLLPCGILVGVGVATFAAGSMVLGRTRE